jgi:GrpB-like predicted nucleotidyltransferase (UPF0157 family)
VIEVVDYDERWPMQFEILCDRYRAALAGLPVVAIEHVGSTSVPGLAAKPIIDVDIVVPAAAVDAAIAALAAIGYEPLGEIGVPQRWAFLAPAGEIRTNTYVVVDGCMSLRNHLAVRAVLRDDEALRAEYAALKQRLAGELGDIDDYVAAKSDILQRILEQAGITSEERAVISEINSRASEVQDDPEGS